MKQQILFVAEQFCALVGRPCCWVTRRCVAFRPPITLRVGLSVASLAIVLCLSRHAHAGAFDYNDSGWQGTTEFLNLARAKLGTSRVRLTAAIDYAKLTPRDALLILHPSVALRSEWLSEFMGRGGRVAVIDDYGRAGSFFDQYEIRRLNAPIRPSASLRGNASLAWAIPSPGTGPENAALVHPLMDGLQRVLTNHPVTLSSSRLTPVLEIPSREGDRHVLGYAGVIGRRGRLFVMGDPSVFINLMLRYPENRVFAERLVSYLVENDTWGPREGQVYLVSNSFAQTDSAHGDWIPKGSANDFWLRARAIIRGPLPEPLAWVLAIVGALYVGHWAWGRLIRSLRPSMPRFAHRPSLLGKPGEAARAAVLAAETTPRALALLELNSGMHCLLTAELNLDGNIDTRALCEALTKLGSLDEQQQRDFKWYTALVNKVQASIAVGRRTRVADADLRRAHRLIDEVVQRINHRSS